MHKHSPFWTAKNGSCVFAKRKKLESRCSVINCWHSVQNECTTLVISTAVYYRILIFELLSSLSQKRNCWRKIRTRRCFCILIYLRFSQYLNSQLSNWKSALLHQEKEEAVVILKNWLFQLALSPRQYIILEHHLSTTLRLVHYLSHSTTAHYICIAINHSQSYTCEGVKLLLHTRDQTTLWRSSFDKVIRASTKKYRLCDATLAIKVGPKKGDFCLNRRIVR